MHRSEWDLHGPDVLFVGRLVLLASCSQEKLSWICRKSSLNHRLDHPQLTEQVCEPLKRHRHRKLTVLQPRHILD
jgi:hypothetical protein